MIGLNNAIMIDDIMIDDIMIDDIMVELMINQ